MEYLNHMASNGVYCKENIDLDGKKIHRFPVDESDKGKAGWAVGFVTFGDTDGRPYKVVVYGNFKTGEKFTYFSEKPESAQDRKKIEADIKEAQIKAEKERLKIHIEVAERCQALWDKMTETLDRSLPYLERKKIDGLS